MIMGVYLVYRRSIQIMTEKNRGDEGSIFDHEEIDAYESIKQVLINNLLNGRVDPEHWPNVLRQDYEKTIVPEVNTVWSKASRMLTKNLTDTELLSSQFEPVWLESVVLGQDGGDYMLQASYCSDQVDICSRTEQIAKLNNLSEHMRFAVSQEEISEIRKNAINAHCLPGVSIRFDVYKVVGNEPLEIKFNRTDEIKQIRLFDTRFAISLPGASAVLCALDSQASTDSIISEAKYLDSDDNRSAVNSIVGIFHKNYFGELSENVRTSALLIEMMCRKMAAAEYLDDFTRRYNDCQRAMVDPEAYNEVTKDPQSGDFVYKSLL